MTTTIGKSRKCNPQKISTPRGDVQSCRLHRDQSVRIVIESPVDMGLSADQHWLTRMESDYLKIEVELRESGRTVYYVSPKESLSGLPPKGQTFLGNFFLDWEGIPNTPPRIITKESFGSIAFYLDAAEPLSALTVINPIKDCHVKLDRDQILEIILPDYPEQICWNAYHFPLETDSKRYLELLRTTFLPSDSCDNKHEDFRCIRRQIANTPNNLGQHHFWFKWSDRSKYDTLNEPKGCYPGERILFVAKNASGHTVVEKSLKVFFGHRGKKLPKNIKENVSTFVKTSIADIADRVLSQERRLLSNPNAHETIFLSGKGDTFIIEAIKPTPTLTALQSNSNQEDYRWVAKIVGPVLSSSAGDNYEASTLLSIRKLLDNSVSGVTFQRFEVTQLCSLIENQSLGSIVLSCPALHLTPKIVNCCFKRGSIIESTPSKALIPCSVIKTQNNHEYSYNYNQNNYSTSRKKTTTLDYSEVGIEELKCDIGDLSVGAVLKPYNHFDSKKKSTVPSTEHKASPQGQNGNVYNEKDKRQKSEKSKPFSQTTYPTASGTTGNIRISIADKEIVLKNGTPLQVMVPVPLDDDNRWEAKIIRQETNAKIQLSTSWVTTAANERLHRFNLMASCNTNKPGRHFVGTIQFGSKDISYICFIFVVVDKIDADKEESSSRMFLPIDGESHPPFPVTQNPISRCLTVVDPFGVQPTRIHIGEGEQLEILIKKASFGKVYTVKTDLENGQCFLVDSSEWRLYDYKKHERFLFRFEGQKIRGRIEIMLGDKRCGEVSLVDGSLQNVTPIPSNISQVHLEQVESDQRLVLNSPADNDAFIIDPFKSSIISFSRPNKYLSNLCAKDHFSANIEFQPLEIPSIVMSRLSSEIASNIKDAWRKVAGIPFAGTSPSQSVSYLMSPIETAVPYIRQLLRAYTEAYAHTLAIVPIGKLNCEFNIQDQFRISTSVSLYVQNVSGVDKVLEDGIDNKHDIFCTQTSDNAYVIDGKILRINVMPKPPEKILEWKLVEWPSWLIPIKMDNYKSSQQFYFYCFLGDKACRRGNIAFQNESRMRSYTIIGYANHQEGR